MQEKLWQQFLQKTKIPVAQKSSRRPNPENTEVRIRRRKEKQNKLQSIRSESNSPSLQRVRSQINFKVSPPKVGEIEKENSRYLANRVSPRDKPWAKMTVLFPNPLFLSTPLKQKRKFCKTRSPVIARNKQTPHKFSIKSPPSASKLQVKIKCPPLVSSISHRISNLESPKLSTASILRRSFSPSRLADRLVPLLKSRKTVQKCEGQMSGLKQRPTPRPVRFSTGRI